MSDTETKKNRLVCLLYYAVIAVLYYAFFKWAFAWTVPFLIGLILAILSRREPDRWYFFSYAGIILNGAVVALCFVTMYLGLVV